MEQPQRLISHLKFKCLDAPIYVLASQENLDQGSLVVASGAYGAPAGEVP